jgi:hypothetical protein
MSYMPYNQIWLNPHMDSLPMWLHHKSEKKNLPYFQFSYCIVLLQWNFEGVLVTNFIYFYCL